MKSFIRTAFIAITSASTASVADLSNFYLLDSLGGLYSVDGDTLYASKIHEIENGFSVVDMVDLGGGNIIVSRAYELYEYNFYTREETSLLNTADYFGPGTIGYFHGLADLGNGELFFSSRVNNQDGGLGQGNSINLDDGTTTTLYSHEEYRSAYFDHHLIAPGFVVSAQFSNQQIHVLDINSGEETTTYNVGLDVVSFFETNGEVFLLTKQGEIHSFDASNGEYSFVGQLEGEFGSRNLIGASVADPLGVFPTPGSLAIFVAFGLSTTHRRRHA
ncbi:MAG: hypothetical protein JJ974_01190 [Phycisphaerales bacterium]|nr:hypothetical protein [Phycisphaerales bacterium]